MKKNTKIGLVVVAGLAAMVSVGICAFRRTPLGHVVWPPRMAPTASDVPVFDAPGRWDKGGRSLDLMVRTVEGDKNSILITRERRLPAPDGPRRWPVLRYARSTRQLARVKSTEWSKAAGMETRPFSFVGHFESFYWEEVDGVPKYRLSPGPLREFPVVGKIALRVYTSPTVDFVSVLSADGPERPEDTGLFGFGDIGGGYYGQHYLEVFRLPEMARVGKATRISLTTLQGISSPCWSADERFIVYTNSDGTKMCVIHVDHEGETP